jgi:hypothetical protein
LLNKLYLQAARSLIEGSVLLEDKECQQQAKLELILDLAE